jgi:streptomycin 6-kinase
VTGPVIPPSMSWIGGTPEGREWLERLPASLAEAGRRWSLELGQPFADAFESLVVPGTRPDGSSVVVKLSHRGRENEYEAEALRVWAGDGAVALFDEAEETGALLLERAEPGFPLSETADRDAAVGVFVDLLPRLWRTAGPPFRGVAEEAAWWSGHLVDEWQRAERPIERELLDLALAALHELPPTQGELVLVHQDLHAGNVLRATRQPWLVIDPKPLLAEREFSLAPIVRGPELGHSRDAVLHRLDTLSAALGPRASQALDDRARPSRGRSPPTARSRPTWTSRAGSWRPECRRRSAGRCARGTIPSCDHDGPGPGRVAGDPRRLRARLLGAIAGRTRRERSSRCDLAIRDGWRRLGHQADHGHRCR